MINSSKSYDRTTYFEITIPLYCTSLSMAKLYYIYFLHWILVSLSSCFIKSHGKKIKSKQSFLSCDILPSGYQYKQLWNLINCCCDWIASCNSPALVLIIKLYVILSQQLSEHFCHYCIFFLINSIYQQKY